MDTIEPEKPSSLEQRLGIDFNSDISVEQIYELIKREHNRANEQLEAFEKPFRGGGPAEPQ